MYIIQYICIMYINISVIYLIIFYTYVHKYMNICTLYNIYVLCISGCLVIWLSGCCALGDHQVMVCKELGTYHIHH